MQRFHLIIAINLLAFFIPFFIPLPGYSQTNPVPKTKSGWKKKVVSGKRGHVAFVKDGLGSSDYLTVKYYQRELLVDVSMHQWVQQRLITGDAPLNGKWTGPIEKLRRLTRNMYTAERRFEVDGKKHLIQIVAVNVDKLNVRMSALIKSETKAANRHQKDADQLRTEILKIEIAAAKADKRGLALEKNPPEVKGLKLRLPIKPGRYAGASVMKKDGKSEQRFDIVLFENGEYEFLNTKRNKSGRFEYSLANGRLELEKPFVNDAYDWDEWCLYGMDGKGRMVIHFETKYRLTQLKWVKESDRIAPTEAKRQAEWAKQEAKRYKHVTELGKGIRSDEIEHVVYSADSAYPTGK